MRRREARDWRARVLGDEHVSASDVCSNIYLHKPSSDPATSTPQKNFVAFEIHIILLANRNARHTTIELTCIFGLHSASWSRGNMPLCGGLTNCLPELKFMLAILNIVSCASLSIVVLCTRTKPAIGSPRSMSALVRVLVRPCGPGNRKSGPIPVADASPER